MKRDKPGDGSQDMVQDYQNILKMKDIKSLKMDYDQERTWNKESGGGSGVAGGVGVTGSGGGGGGKKIASSSSLIDAARAAGLDIAPSTSDPMSSISALLAAAQATGGLPPSCSTSSDKTKPSSASSSSGAAGPSASQGLDLSNPQTAMANVNVSQTPSSALHSHPVVLFQAQMQMYYYIQKLQTAGMGNPKERKECPICGKTLYDRSTWNRHMRIHTGNVLYKSYNKLS